MYLLGTIETPLREIRGSLVERTETITMIPPRYTMKFKRMNLVANDVDLISPPLKPLALKAKVVEWICIFPFLCWFPD